MAPEMFKSQTPNNFHPNLLAEEAGGVRDKEEVDILIITH
ncbi:MAG: hypothetical protein PVSMB11_12420 [Desulfuromonadaceae bacterium]